MPNNCLTVTAPTPLTGDTSRLPVAPGAVWTLPVSGATRRFVANALTQAVDTDVTSWADHLGGSPATVAGGGTSATAPTLVDDAVGGFRALEFDGAADGLGLAHTGPQPYTLMILARMRSLPAGNKILYGAGSGTNGNIFISGSLGTWQANAGAGLNVPATGSGVPDTGWHVITAVFNGATSRLRVDDSAITGDAGTTAPTSMIFGRLPGTPSAGTAAPVNIAEAVLWPSVLSTSDVDTLVAAFRNRYRL